MWSIWFAGRLLLIKIIHIQTTARRCIIMAPKLSQNTKPCIVIIGERPLNIKIVLFVSYTEKLFDVLQIVVIMLACIYSAGIRKMSIQMNNNFRYFRIEMKIEHSYGYSYLPFLPINAYKLLYLIHIDSAEKKNIGWTHWKSAYKCAKCVKLYTVTTLFWRIP